ncbi:pyridoxal phosphate-dependent aminotransferase [Acidobacteriota bacterium]
MRFNRNVQRTEMPPMVELARRAVELAQQGADVIRLDQGAVDIAPPAAFVEGVLEALADPEVHRYAPDPGLPGLRAALARYGSESFDVAWDPRSEIVVSAGANQACFAALMALVEPGDEVLLPSPWYFNHAMTVTALGAIPVPVATRVEEGFAPTVGAVAEAITPRTRVLVLINPNNPTGARYEDDLIRELVQLAVEKDLWVLSDQTYHELHFGTAPPLSPAAVVGARDRVITIVSFSKSLGLAGWRLGLLAAHADVVTEILKIQDCSVICAARAGQEGLLAALPGIEAHVMRTRDALLERRDRLVAALRAANLDAFIEPAGSLFLFLHLPDVHDDWDYCHRLLEEQHVVAVPGSVFGPDGEGSIRLSYGSTAPDRLGEVADRIANLRKGPSIDG